MANIGSYIKVFKELNEILGIAVLHYYLEDNKYYITINPIVVSPTKMNCGYGTKILKYSIDYSDDLVGGKVDYIRCNIDNTNKASLKLINKFEFKKEKDNNNFIQYVYKK